MTKSEKELAVEILYEIAEAFEEGAAGGLDYWFTKLAERIRKRAINLHLST
uniref:Uncharacterized protein n=1 Tax=viral metagenome TaxID=1070528 RepID=A0A6H1ZQV4_9ZZZZ